ncbi:MAG: hypothetical protein IID44_30105 [Planctomycetes bacterium]|nr:hypothetical protein [Planctomycetota bacterium]
MKTLSFLVIVAMVVLFHSSARAAPYTLEIVAQAGDIIDGRLITGFSQEVIRVGISDDREVAFFAYVAGPGASDLSLMTQRRFIAGGGKVVDGWVPQFGSEPSLAINGLGDVAYKATIPNVARGVFLNQNLLLLAGDVIDGEEISVIQDPPAINDAGTIVIKARPGPVKLSINSPSEIIVKHGILLDGFTVDSFSEPRINNAGDAVFRGSLEELLPGPSIAALSPDGVLLKTGDLIEDLTVEIVRTVSAVTDAGDVLVSVSSTGIDGEGVVFIGTQDQILFRTGDIVADIQVSRITGNPVLNNRGQLAFLGFVDAPGETGYFPGMRGSLFASGALVISEGDILKGKVIRELHPEFDMNEHGDVAFKVMFTDFSHAVVLATPNIPEPSSFVLALLGVVFLLTRRSVQNPVRACPTRNEEVMR